MEPKILLLQDTQKVVVLPSVCNCRTSGFCNRLIFMGLGDRPQHPTPNPEVGGSPYLEQLLGGSPLEVEKK